MRSTVSKTHSSEVFAGIGGGTDDLTGAVEAQPHSVGPRDLVVLLDLERISFLSRHLLHFLLGYFSPAYLYTLDQKTKTRVKQN